MRLVPAVLVILIIILLGGFVYLSFREDSSGKKTQQTSQQRISAPTPLSIAPFAYRDTGFFPPSRTVRVPVPVKVVIVNQTKNSIDIASNSNSEFNLEQIAAGKSRTVELEQIGLYEFYNTTNASHHASVLIQDPD